MTTTPSETRESEHPVLSRRERTRAATIEEIKETALRLMHEQGTTDLRFSDIAREMGMTAPALYRYFADRDELLTALIADAYDDLAVAVEEARSQVPVEDPTGRWHAVSQAYRAWASREPQQFALIFGMPVPGYVAPDAGPTTEACRRAIGALKALFFEAMAQGVLGRPLIREVGESFATALQEDHDAKHADEPVIEPETFQSMLQCWASLHGFTSLEAYGHLQFLPEEARDTLFEANVRLTAITAGLPLPADPSKQE
ncbi:MAG: TetR family transcriptional regulator [Propionibacteriales bacterium]|nr:TetR family transcriptional regulator [Propionibacteriales bacterium]